MDSYDCGYLVGRIGHNPYESELLSYSFPKNSKDRLKFLLNLGMAASQIEQSIALKHFPQQGNNCMRYNKACKHFEHCSLSSLGYHKELLEEDQTEYQFVMAYEDLLNQ